MAILRPYQESAIEQIALSFSKLHKRVILCMPTGAGKSMVFSTIAEKTALKGNKVVILTHRKELKKQAESYGSNCEVVMVEKLNNILKKQPDYLDRVQLIIIDEAHIGNFKKILEVAPESSFVIGCTATPLSKPPMNKYYSDIIDPISIGDLITLGYLARPISYQKKLEGVDFAALVVKSGEFTTQSQESEFKKSRVFGGVVEDYKQFGKGRKAIVFCCSILETISTFDDFDLAGIEPIFYAHSKQKNELRDEQIALFMASTNGILINCGIATTGFDCPDIEIVIIKRATLSVPLWMQMCGRGSRVVPGQKTEFEIWDYGDNLARLGHWEQRINWTQIFHEPEKTRSGLGVANVKECDGCGALVYQSARLCKYCGNFFEVGAVAILDGDLCEVEYTDVLSCNGKMLFDLTLVELAQLVKFKRHKKIFFEMVLYFAERIEELENYWNEKKYKIGYRAKRYEFFGTIEKGIRNYKVKI